MLKISGTLMLRSHRSVHSGNRTARLHAKFTVHEVGVSVSTQLLWSLHVMMKHPSSCGRKLGKRTNQRVFLQRNPCPCTDLLTWCAEADFKVCKQLGFNFKASDFVRLSDMTPGCANWCELALKANTWSSLSYPNHLLQYYHDVC